MNKKYDPNPIVYRRLLGGLAFSICLVVLTGCSIFSFTPASPDDMVFDAPIDEIVGGIRLAPVESQWDGYGEAVDVRGDVMVIGASEWNQLGPGSAYVYRHIAGEWQEEAQLIASDRESGQFAQRFGNAVTLGEGMIAIGAPGNDDPQAGENTGAVYLFEFQEQVWVETAKLTPAPTGVNQVPVGLNELDYGRMRPRSFSALVTLEGDTLAVGGDAGGMVYIFQREEGVWKEQAQIPVPTLPRRDLYMASMTLFGDTLALSAFYVSPRPEESLVLSGNVVVYVFERIGSTWEESFRFSPDEGEVDLLFFDGVNIGASVALEGEAGEANLLAIGLPGSPDWSETKDHIGMFGANPEQIPSFPPSHRQTGAVYLFERMDSGWTHRVTLKPAGWETPPGPGSLFSSVPTHLEEAPGNTDEAGSGYLSSIGIPENLVFPGHIFSENPEVSFFGATVDLDGEQLAVTAGFANATYVFERRGQDWVYRFSVKPGNEKMEMWEDSAQVVAISGRTLLLGTPGEFGNSAYVFRLCMPFVPNCQ